MRQIVLAFAIAVTPAAAAYAESLGVPLDQSIRIGLRTPARQVIVGNPAIADVTVADPHHLIVTGKTGGVTNLIVTDVTGRAIFDRQIVVSGTVGGDHVALIKGAQVVSYACAPACAEVGAEQAGPAAPSSGGGAPPAAAPAPGNTSAVQASPGTP